MDRLETMALLVAITERGSFSAASRALRIPLATVSRRISDLESRLGARLLIRTTRRLTLTDSGLGYVAAARRILAEVDEAERTAVGEFAMPKGELVVSAPLMFGRLHVLPVVADFLASYPAIDVRLVLTDRNVDLVADDVDMVVRIGPLPDSSMVATAIGTLRTVICASPALLARHGIPRKPDALGRMPSVALGGGSTSSGSWRFVDPRSGAALEVQVAARLTVTTTDAAAQAAVRGVGATRLLHYQVADGVASGALKIVLKSWEPAPTPVHLLHASRGQMPLKMRRFLDFAAPRLRDVLGRLSGARKD
jgi:DNA-binding transcriptional LysR family regulator